MELWTEYEGQVSHIVPPLCHAPLPTLISPYLSLQALSTCLPHHILHLWLLYGRSCTSGMNSPFRLYTCPPLPPPPLFSVLEVLGRGFIHSCMYYHVYTTPSCLKVRYLTAFSCPWKLTVFYCKYILAWYLHRVRGFKNAS